jgi:DNA-binding NarL/FixJ family response regulator
MAGALRTLVAVDAGLDTHEFANTVTSDTDINVVGVINGMEEAWRALQDSSCDVLVVACEGYSERALALIDSSVKQNPQRPVLVLA